MKKANGFFLNGENLSEGKPYQTDQKHQKRTNVIIFTHNIDFIFLQSVVLSVLKNIGHAELTVFADVIVCRIIRQTV